ncbi:beta-ketoacyl synthase chain length factor [Castellaniella caeni]|uniref:beta-ketoacyl synthase chain length factor n=1 Tax=Castellaniella caeni TaxID=266123 RepID=UPI00082B7917|nr:beta-ketoacyl synthase chain length factor [Castellaniella caeni]
MEGIHFRLLAWHARVPLASCAKWLPPSQARPGNLVDAAAAMRHLPMMTARRLGVGDRLVVDGVLSLLADQAADALVLCSQHGELERNDRILQSLAADQPVSPTDFTMSVHNAAAGTCTIVAGQPLVSTSLSAGADTFQQALFEVMGFFQAGHRRVILADFEGHIPAFYQRQAGVVLPVAPYAVCLLLVPGTDWRCQPRPLGPASAVRVSTPGVLPQSLQWLRALVQGRDAHAVQGQSHEWHWSHTP